MGQRSKLELFERRVEECLTVSKRLLFSLFEMVMFLLGLYTLAKIVMHF